MDKRTIYLAGGCFWGVERLMRSLHGVTDATSGYANGTGEQDANYQTVCGGETGFRETVKVEYDPAKTDLARLLYAYFAVIDPTARDRQGHDVGSQYQAGVYYADAESERIVKRIADLVKRKTAGFAVEILPLKNFFPAEAYHQNYLAKNPSGYCHIPFDLIARLAEESNDPHAAPFFDE